MIYKLMLLRLLSESFNILFPQLDDQFKTKNFA